MLETSILENSSTPGSSAVKPSILISLLGQIGSGKTALLNALMGTQFRTDKTQPSTGIAQQVLINGSGGRKLVIEDLPGMGWGNSDYASYLALYREKLVASDVLLWAIHGECRLIALDLEMLHRLLAAFSRPRRAKLVQKLVFVITKVDLHATAPWILVRLGMEGYILPHPLTQVRLEQKIDYYRDLFLQPYRTQSADHYQVIPCSAQFRYNLTGVLAAIYHQLGQDALPFDYFLCQQKLNRVSFEAARQFSNLITFEPTPFSLF